MSAPKTAPYLGAQTPEEAFPLWWQGLDLHPDNYSRRELEILAGQAFIAAVVWMRSENARLRHELEDAHRTIRAFVEPA